MEKMVKKLLSVAIALAMVISWLPGNALQADAAASENLCACGCGKAATAVQWQAFGGSALSQDGHYYLSDNLALTATLTVSAAVTLDLRGKDITPAAGVRTIYINSGASLTILDTVGGGEVYGADITASGEYGGAIYVCKDATLNVLGGVIRDGKAGRGGNILSQGATTISGKSRVINGNADRGGNIYVTAGSTTVTGYAKILDGVATTTGGNIMVQNTTTTLTLAGRTTVAGGQAKNGINVASMYGNVVITDHAVVDAGATEGATSMNIGGNGDEYSTLDISGGTLYGKVDVGALVSSIKISGAPVIKHLSLATGKRIDPTGMTEGASVTVEAVDTAITDTLTDAAGYLPYFHAYSSNKLVTVSGNALQLSAGCPCGCGAENPTWTTWSGGAITASGHYRLSAAKTLSGTVTVAGGTADTALNVVIDLNGKTLTAASGVKAIEISKYSTLTIVDIAGSGSVKGASVTGNAGTILVNDYATLNLRSGTITGGTASSYGGNIYSTGTVNVYGGTISSGNASRGGNIFANYGGVNVYGGTISGGNASVKGGNICIAGSRTSVRAYGGTITGGTDAHGGGNIYATGSTDSIYITGTANVTTTSSNGNICAFYSNLYISGGTVSGSAIRVSGYDGAHSKAIISGGTIKSDLQTENSSNTLVQAELVITGGTFSGTVSVPYAKSFILSGAPQITNMTVGSTVNVTLGELSPEASITFNGAWGISENISWLYVDSGKLYLAGTGPIPHYHYQDNPAPWLTYAASITSATIGEGITAIGDYTLYECSKLSSVTIPGTVTSIGHWVFYKTAALKTITIPASVTFIDSYAFGSASVTSVVYGGTQAQWDAIHISASGNTVLTNPTAFQCQETPTKPVAPVSGNTGWSVSGNTLTITGTGAMPNYYRDTTLTKCSGAPWGAYADQITNIVIGSGVTHVGGWAFYGLKNVTSVTIPSTVIEIGDHAFQDCAALQTVSFANVKKIGGNAFQGCTALTTVTGSSALTSIGDFAFFDCSNLNTVSGLSTVNAVGDQTFNGCTSLTAFGNWFGDNYQVVEGVLYGEVEGVPTLLRVPGGYTGSFTVPESVTAIGNYAFANCVNITEVTISDTVTTIGGAAFDGCSAVKTITFGTAVKSLGTNAFAYCSSQEAFVVPAGNASYSSDDTGALCSPGKTVVYRAPGGVEKYTLAKGRSSIALNAFACNDTVQEVTLAEKTTTIGSSAFAATGNLRAIHANTALTTVSKNAFEGSALTDVYYTGNLAQWNTITVDVNNAPLTAAKVHCTLMDTTSCGDGVTATLDTDGLLTITGAGVIADYSAGGAPWYAYADQITTLNLSSGITAIGNNAFAGCTALANVIYDGTQAQWERMPKGTGNEVLDSASVGGFTAAVPVGITITKLPDKVDYMVGETVDTTGMEVSVLYNDETTAPADLADCVIGELTMPGKPEITVTYGDFEATMQLNVSATGTSGAVNWTIDKDGKLTVSGNGEMDYNAVAWSAYMTVITSAEIQTGVVGDLSKGAFSNAVNLQSVSLPEGIEWISANAFYRCTSLTEIVLPASVTSIRDNAFNGCTNLKTVTIGEVSGEIKTSAFANCAALTDVYFAGDMTKWLTYGVTLPTGATVHCAKRNLVRVDVTWTQDAKAEYYMTEELDLTGMVVTLVYDDASTEETTDYTAVCDFTVTGTQTVEIKYQGQTVYSYEVTVFPAGVSAEGFNWSIDAEGLLTIIGSGEMAGYTEEAPAPWAAYAERITAVVIGGEITTIGTYAFANCVNLTTVSLPKSVTAIGENAFAGCAALAEVNYAGLETDWTNVVVGDGNEAFIQATFVFQTLYGDVNGDGEINTNDTLRLMKYLAGWDVEVDEKAADVNADGILSTKDTLRLMKYLANWEVVLGPQ